MLHFYFLKLDCGRSCGTNIGYCCVFPFTYKGKKYTSCTTAGSTKHWCAYAVDSSGVYHSGSGKWDYCKDGCKHTDFKGTRNKLPQRY